MIDINLIDDRNKNILVDSFAIEKIEKDFLKEQQVECPVVHRFGPGVYIREVMIPAGTFAIGHHQNFEHTNVFLKGRVTILNEDGSTSEISAPMIFTGKPGRKIGYIHEDMVWLNVYPTAETDVEKLEEMFLTKSDTWIEHQSTASMQLLKNSIDVNDYHKTLAEFGFTDEVARAQSFNTEDMMELPFGGYKIKVSKSTIDGRGLFATALINEDEIIAPARINGKRTIAGRYPNHSISPNAIMKMKQNGDIDLVATKEIKGCFAGNDGEEITVNYRDSLALQIKRKEVPCLE